MEVDNFEMLEKNKRGKFTGEYFESEEPDIKLEKSVEASQEESKRCREIGYDWPHIKLKIESEIKQEDTTEDEKQDEEQRKEDSISSIVMTEYGIKLEPSLKLERVTIRIKSSLCAIEKIYKYSVTFLKIPVLL